MAKMQKPELMQEISRIFEFQTKRAINLYESRHIPSVAQSYFEAVATAKLCRALIEAERGDSTALMPFKPPTSLNTRKNCLIE